MTPNIDQILSIVRWLLSVGGPVGALLIARKVPPEQVTALQTAILSIIGALPPIVSFIWGMFAHTDKAKIIAASDVTDAQGKKTIVVTTPEIAAATPAQQNIVSSADAKVVPQ